MFVSDKKIKYRKKLLIINQKFNTQLTNLLLKNDPELSFGRKNYLSKEMEICKNICLIKLFKEYKKINGKYIKLIFLKKKLNNIILKSEIYY